MMQKWGEYKNTALLTGKQKLLKHKRISQVSKKIESGMCAFIDLHCCVTHLLALTAGNLMCLSACLINNGTVK